MWQHNGKEGSKRRRFILDTRGDDLGRARNVMILPKSEPSSHSDHMQIFFNSET